MLRALPLLLVLTTACALTPYSGESVDTNRIPVEGLTRYPGVRVRVDAIDWQTNRFFMVGNATSATTPTFTAGQICPNSPALYLYRTTTDPLMWPIFWKKNAAGAYETKVRATMLTATGSELLKFTANPSGQSCMAQHGFNSTCDFLSIASICGYTLDEAVVVSTKSSPWN